MQELQNARIIHVVDELSRMPLHHFDKIIARHDVLKALNFTSYWRPLVMVMVCPWMLSCSCVSIHLGPATVTLFLVFVR